MPFTSRISLYVVSIFAAAQFLIACGDDETGGSGGDTGGTDTADDGACEGTAIENIPNRPAECPPPPAPTDPCSSALALNVDFDEHQRLERLVDSQETELSAVVAPDGTQYVATQQNDLEEIGPPSPPDTQSHCIVQKAVRLYRRELDGTVTHIDEIPINGEGLKVNLGETNPDDLRWYTDPYLAVSQTTGAVYLQVLKWHRLDARSCVGTTSRLIPSTDFDEEVQLWVLPPGGDELHKVALAADGITSAVSIGFNESHAGPDPADLGAKLDHPRVAAFGASPSQDIVVSTWNMFDNKPDRFATMECLPLANPPTCERKDVAEHTEGGGAMKFPQPGFDANGDLYISHTISGGPEVIRFERDGDGWAEVDRGGPTPLGQYFQFFSGAEAISLLKDETEGIAISIDTTPSLAIEQVEQAGDDTEPALFVAWVTRDTSTNNYDVEFSAASVNDLSAWTPARQIPKPSLQNYWGPNVSVNGSRNILDISFYRSGPSPTMDHELLLGTRFSPRIARYRAHDQEFVVQGVVSSQLSEEPTAPQLPRRGPAATGLFLGEYTGIDHIDQRVVVAYNAQQVQAGSFPETDPAVAIARVTCGQRLQLTNGTTASGLQVTCQDSAQIIGTATFGSSLVELCEAFPLCAGAEELDLTIEASDNSDVIATASLQKSGEAIQTAEDAAALAVGEHTIEICATDSSTSDTGCTDQLITAAPPLGSGVDSFGNFAGEIAGAFVPLAGVAGATVVTLGDDDVATVDLPAGFDFPFYDLGSFDELVVGANGGIRLSAGGIGPNNAALPSTSDAPEIAVLWDDWDPSSDGDVLTFFDGTRFIVSWESVRHAGAAGAEGAGSFQAHLFADGRIEFHYFDVDLGVPTLDNGGEATVGIQDGLGDFVQVAHEDESLLASGVRGLGFAASGCIASQVEIPTSIACTAPDLSLTACEPAGGVLSIPNPDVQDCAEDATILVGTVVRSGPSETALVDLTVPQPIVNGTATLDVGTHVVEWVAQDSDGFVVAEPFEQVLIVSQWLTEQNCCAPGQTTITLTDSGDILDLSNDPSPVCVLALGGGDIVDLGAGDDTLLCGPSGDIVDTGDGANVVVCEDGGDIADGGDGPDRMHGGQGPDTFDGNDGDDVLRGDEDGDILTAHDGRDVLWGGAGGDILKGGGDEDQLYPGAGNDIVKGQGGDDEFFLLDECEIAGGGKILSGGSGTDTLYVPEGWTLQDVKDEGNIVTSIENVVELPAPRNHESHCS